jgi:hypothetical protein
MSWDGRRIGSSQRTRILRRCGGKPKRIGVGNDVSHNAPHGHPRLTRLSRNGFSEWAIYDQFDQTSR